jgi:hypothetical protein
MASNVFLSAGFNIDFLTLIGIEYIAGVMVWFVFEKLLLSDYTWEWHVRLSVIGALVLLPGIVLYLVANSLS